VIAATHSGAGKTTVTTGILAALRRAGVRVASAKVGPDYIDPGYHQLATGRPSRNLDLWMCGRDAVLDVAARAAAGAELVVVEGVMGLFDGAGDATASSTADIADLLQAPVVLVVDASATSQSIAAVVHGFRSFDRRVRLAGVILNRVGSDGHETLLRSALAAIDAPVVGALRRDDRLMWRDRHLGLIPVVERTDQVADSLNILAHAISEHVDLSMLRTIAASAPALRPVTTVTAQERPDRTRLRVRIGVAAGAAFSFVYPDNLEALREAGAEIVEFDPLLDHQLPDRVGGLFVGGGFPEVYADQLGANTRLLDQVRARIAGGLVTWAECGGLLWLAQSLDGRPMAGVVPAEATMTPQLTLGYRTATTRLVTPLGPAGTSLRGHEFHYSTTEPIGDALHLVGRHGEGTGGFGAPHLLASYLHVHLAGRKHIATHFVDTCRAALPLPYVG
jgi:cobyrinic acid a,c-diamide synthase